MDFSIMAQDYIFRETFPQKIRAFDPRRAIIPIIKLDSKGGISKFLGTGFFVARGEIPVVVSAKHLFTRNPLQDKEKYGFVCFGEGKKVVAQVCGLKLCQNFDIAVFHSDLLLPDLKASKLARGMSPQNAEIFTLEYSSSRPNTTEDGEQSISFNTFTHRGNIRRYYICEDLDKIPTPSFDASFPALLGVSGAPVIRAIDHAVVGMVVRSQESDLPPTQIIKTDDENGHKEERRYFLPTAQALTSDVIIAFLQSIKIYPEVVE